MIVLGFVLTPVETSAQTDGAMKADWPGTIATIPQPDAGPAIHFWMELSAPTRASGSMFVTKPAPRLPLAEKAHREHCLEAYRQLRDLHNSRLDSEERGFFEGPIFIEKPLLEWLEANDDSGHVVHTPFSSYGVRLGRWKGNVGPLLQTDLELHTDWIGHEASDHSHFDLVWTGRSFELREYVLPVATGRCSIGRTAMLEKVTQLEPVLSEPELSLVPVERTGLITDYLVLTDQGKFETRRVVGSCLSID